MYTQTHPTQFGIHLKTKDIKKSLWFYHLFGFEPIFALGDDAFVSQFTSIQTVPEAYCGVIFQIGNALLEIADGHIAVKPEVFQQDITSSKISAMVYVESVDAIVKICEENAIPVVVPVREFPWGTREVVIKDPDGFVLVFIEKIK